jgi:hypothetical protein
LLLNQTETLLQVYRRLQSPGLVEGGVVESFQAAAVVELAVNQLIKHPMSFSSVDPVFRSLIIHAVVEAELSERCRRTQVASAVEVVDLVCLVVQAPEVVAVLQALQMELIPVRSL